MSRTATVALLAAAVLLAAALVPATPAHAGQQAADRIDVLTVEDGDPARLVFAAPPQLATRTLTDGDLDVQVAGEARQARLQRLSANDLEVAVVVDTTLGADDLRALQAAVVEFALALPQGAALRIVDAEGTATEPAPVPGPAIAAIRTLRAGTGDDLSAAVAATTGLLDASPAGRTALLVLGRDLSQRMDPVDDRPFGSLSYLVTIGGDTAGMLGPRAGGHGVAVDGTAGVPAATDTIAGDLRSLYLVEIPGAGGRDVTLRIAADEGTTAETTVGLDPDRLRPVPADAAAAPEAEAAPDQEAEAQPQAAPDDPAAAGDAPAGGWLPWVLLAGALGAAAVAFVLWRTLDRTPAVPAPSLPVQPPPPPLPVQPVGPTRRRPGQAPPRPQRPIAKLAPETREVLARAHLGLRTLALASRDVAEILPDHMFRLSEARASAALEGHDASLEAVLLAMLRLDGAPASTGGATAALVQRAADALSTGWEHTAQLRSAPPAVVEINTLLRGRPARGDQRDRPVTPVRALNPLVEIGIEHMVLAAQSEEHAGLVARAVTAVDIMRAARLARPVLALSPFLLTDVARYRAACSADPAEPAPRDDWLQFLCDGIVQCSRHAADQLTRLRRLRARYRDAAPDVATARLIDVLLARPVLDATLLAQRLALPHEQATGAAEAAQAAGWLHPHPDDARAWRAGEVLDVFTAPAHVTTGSRQPA